MVARTLRALRWARRKRGSIKRILLIPPAPPGSLGDEAMIQGITAAINNRGAQTFCYGYTAPNEWSFINNVLKSESIGDYINWESRRRLYSLLLKISNYDLVLLVGADVLDGNYSVDRSLRRMKLLLAISMTGTPTEIVGCSFNDSNQPDCVDMIQRLSSSGTKIRSRDPESARRLQSVCTNPIDLVADAAFLLIPNETSDTVQRTKQWCRTKKSEHRPVIGININSHHVKNTPDPSVFLQSILTAMENIAVATNAAFILLPHDYRGKVSDYTLLCNLKTKYEAKHPRDCFLIDVPMKAEEIKGVVSEINFVLSGRMHLAIACLGVETPVGCITYQGKFEGLMEHFELEDVLISPDEILIPERLTNFLSSLSARQHSLHEQISVRLPMVTKLAEKNIPSL